MKAQLINKFGDPSVFELTAISKPTIKPGHLINPHKFTLETVKEAHALLESGKAQGKVVISII